MRARLVRICAWGVVALASTSSLILPGETPTADAASRTAISRAPLFVDAQLVLRDGSTTLTALGFLEVETKYQPGAGNVEVKVRPAQEFVLYDVALVPPDYKATLEHLAERGRTLQAQLEAAQARLQQLEAELIEAGEDPAQNAEFRGLLEQIRLLRQELTQVIEETKRVLNELQKAAEKEDRFRYELAGNSKSEATLVGAGLETDVSFMLKEKRGERATVRGSLSLQFSPLGEYRSGSLTSLCVSLLVCDSGK